LGETLQGDAQKCLDKTLHYTMPKDVCSDTVVYHLKRLGIPLAADANGLLGYTKGLALAVGGFQRSLAMPSTGEVDVGTWSALLLPVEEYRRRTQVAAPKVEALKVTEQASRERQASETAAKQAAAQAAYGIPGAGAQGPASETPWGTYALVGGGVLGVIFVAWLLLR